MSKRKPNGTGPEKMMLMEEYESRQDVLRAKFSSTITSSTVIFLYNLATCMFNRDTQS
jgi:hypothetical protein